MQRRRERRSSGFQRLSLMRGYGAGSSGLSRALSFTYGLSAEDSTAYLKLPPGQGLRREGNELGLVAAVPLPTLFKEVPAWK